jgi:hypothetical protein
MAVFFFCIYTTYVFGNIKTKAGGGAIPSSGKGRKGFHELWYHG